MSEEPLAPGGFRLRGKEVSRVEALSDGVFALAMTLLVISVEPPKSYDSIVDILRGVPAFACCFATLIWIWYSHYCFFRRYGLQDTTTIFWNSVLLFLVLLYVYPLKFVFTQFSAIIPELRPRDLPRVGAAEMRGLFVFYGIGFASVFSVQAFLSSHAYRLRANLELSAKEAYRTRAEIFDDLWVAAVGLVSISIAVLAPDRWVPFAGWCYCLIGVARGSCGFYFRSHEPK